MNDKKSSKAKKDMAKSVHKARYLMMKIMTWKTTSRGTFQVDVSKFRDFFHKLYIKFFPSTRENKGMIVFSPGEQKRCTSSLQM